MRQLTIASTALVLFASIASAQERIAPEEAQKYSRLLAEHAGKVDAPQIKTDADADRPYGIRKEEIGLLVIPDRNLTEEALQKIGKDVVPVGQLWVRNVTPFVDGAKIANDKLRIVTININGDNHDLPLFFLGARKKGEDLELVLYAKDKDPLVSLPLVKINNQQEMPIELEGKKGDNETGILTLGILGKLQAKLVFAKQD